MSKLLINESPLQVLPSLAVKLGLNEAIFVQQLHFLARTKEGYHQDDRTWVRRTVAEWHEQFPWWSERTIKRIIASLTADSLLITAEHSDNAWDHTQSYSIDHAKLDSLVTTDSDNLSPSHDSDNLSPSSIVFKEDKKEEQKHVAAQRTTASPPSPTYKPILDSWILLKKEREARCVINYAAETKAAKALAKEGWTPDQVLTCATILYNDPFYGSSALSLWTVAKQIAAKHTPPGSGGNPPPVPQVLDIDWTEMFT